MSHSEKRTLLRQLGWSDDLIDTVLVESGDEATTSASDAVAADQFIDASDAAVDSENIRIESGVALALLDDSA